MQIIYLCNFLCFACTDVCTFEKNDPGLLILVYFNLNQKTYETGAQWGDTPMHLYAGKADTHLTSI